MCQAFPAAVSRAVALPGCGSRGRPAPASSSRVRCACSAVTAAGPAAVASAWAMSWARRVSAACRSWLVVGFGGRVVPRRTRSAPRRAWPESLSLIFFRLDCLCLAPSPASHLSLGLEEQRAQPAVAHQPPFRIGRFESGTRSSCPTSAGSQLLVSRALAQASTTAFSSTRCWRYVGESRLAPVARWAERGCGRVQQPTTSRLTRQEPQPAPQRRVEP